MISFPLFGALGWLFYRCMWGFMATAWLCLPAMRIYESHRLYNQRRRAYQELRDVLYMMSSAFASGRGFQEAMKESSRTLRFSYGEDSLLAKETEYICRVMVQGNVSEIRLLKEFSERSGFSELSQVEAIYSLCLRTGGDLPKAMIEASDAMLRRLQLWQEIEATTSQKRLEFAVMTAVVPLLLAVVGNTSDYLTPCYETAGGRILMTAALLGLFGAAAWSTAILEGGRR